MAKKSSARMTRRQVADFLRRWRLVNEFEREELRRTTVTKKLRQLAAMMALARGMKWTRALAAEEQEVRERWQRLRRAYGF